MLTPMQELLFIIKNDNKSFEKMFNNGLNDRLNDKMQIQSHIDVLNLTRIRIENVFLHKEETLIKNAYLDGYSEICNIGRNYGQDYKDVEDYYEQNYKNI